MSVETSKRLPGCGHIFHKSCLREWLVQQQTCPTCRGDISAMEARQRQQDAVDAQNREQAQEENEEEEKDGGDDDGGEDQTGTDAANGENGVGANEDIPSLSNKDSSSEFKRTSLSLDGLGGADKKPAANSTSRGKRVRIVTPGTVNGKPPPLDSSVFPAFYRVAKDAGAAVYNDGDAISFAIRMIPFGVVILGQEMAWRNCDGESRMMIKIPDGWVCDDHLERVVAVQFNS